MKLELSDTAAQVVDEILQQTNISLGTPNLAVVTAGVVEFREAVAAARRDSGPDLGPIDDMRGIQ